MWHEPSPARLGLLGRLCKRIQGCQADSVLRLCGGS